MDKGPHIIPLTPGGVPVIIHASQGEHYKNTGYSIGKGDWKFLDISFRLLTSDNQYYDFLPEQPDSPAYDSLYPADLFYTRPDGATGKISLRLARDLVVLVDGGGNKKYSDPYDLYLLEIPEKLTEVAGDVECEIVVYRGSNTDNRRESSANFIIRVEPKPQVLALPHYTVNAPNHSARQYASDKDREEQTPSYYTGDPVDTSLLTWAEVVEEANTGDLREILTPGQEIRAEMLTTGQYMGIRCVHVVDHRTAYFESKHLFKAPKVYEGIDLYGRKFKYVGHSAAWQWVEPPELIDGYRAPKELPYSIKSVSGDSYHGKPGYWSSLTLPQPVNIWGGTDEYFSDGYGYINEQFDYYKTPEGRVKRTPDGIIRQWITGGTDARLVNSSVVVNNYYYVDISGSKRAIPSDEAPDDIYVPLVWKLVGEEHTDPATVPFDIQSWQDVKRAAERGRLLNSNLTLGQLMPELPSGRVLRCVHITPTWAAFDTTILKETSIDTAITQSFATNRFTYTEEEMNLFTLLSEGGGGKFYAQMGSGKNLGKNNMYGPHTSFSNAIVASTVFDYYADGDDEKTIKRNESNQAATYWVGSGYSGAQYTCCYIGADGKIKTDNVGNSGRHPNHYLNPVFVVGTIA